MLRTYNSYNIAETFLLLYVLNGADALYGSPPVIFLFKLIINNKIIRPISINYKYSLICVNSMCCLFYKIPNTIPYTYTIHSHCIQIVSLCPSRSLFYFLTFGHYYALSACMRFMYS